MNHEQQHFKLDFFRYNFFLLFITYLLPLTVLSIAYTKIGMELWGAKQIGEYMQVENVKAKRKVKSQHNFYITSLIYFLF